MKKRIKPFNCFHQLCTTTLYTMQSSTLRQYEEFWAVKLKVKLQDLWKISLDSKNYDQMLKRNNRIKLLT